jgi:hypothetical protein
MASKGDLKELAAAAREAGLRLKFEVGTLDLEVPTGEVKGLRVDVKRWYREVAKVRG